VPWWTPRLEGGCRAGTQCRRSATADQKQPCPAGTGGQQKLVSAEIRRQSLNPLDRAPGAGWGSVHNRWRAGTANSKEQKRTCSSSNAHGAGTGVRAKIVTRANRGHLPRSGWADNLGPEAAGGVLVRDRSDRIHRGRRDHRPWRTTTLSRSPLSGVALGEHLDEGLLHQGYAQSGARSSP